MIFKSLLYAIYTALSAYVESVRIKKSKAKNVSHFISTTIGILGFLLIIWIFKIKSIVDLTFYAIICILIRGSIYDPLLNFFRGKEIDYESPSSTSNSDKTESFFKWGFWKQRRIYFYSFLFMICLYYILKFSLGKLF